MSTSLPKLTADPLSIVRQFPTFLIRPEQIETRPGIEEDPVFQSKYTSFLLGKTCLHTTRVNISSIRRGFWRSAGGSFELSCDPISDEDLTYTKDVIRLGSRPPLFLYESPNAQDQRRYVCADDAVAHAAYEELGIEIVPAALMCKPRDLEESCISFKSLKACSGERITLMDGMTSVVHKFVPSILRSRPLSAGDAFDSLLSAIERTKVALRSFHRAGTAKFHYHHTMYSVLARATETLESMKLLVETARTIIAASLLRPLYELTMTFYIDWLSPDSTYRYLQLASVMSERDWDASCTESMKEHIANGLSSVEAKNIKDAHMRAYRLCSVVAEKARAFPLGEAFHRDIYAFLSDIVHHDFSMTARYSHTLEHGDDAVYTDDVTKSMLHIADVLVASIVHRIRSDIGAKSADSSQ